ncbi:MAG: hypothetical protein LLF86_04580 [Nitrospiraceae bacterium]|nr:hypothetical protein [Nitrospiraceae bacterium]
MDINSLRQIGKRLFGEIGSMRLVPFSQEPLAKGAGGDKTFAVDKKAEDIIISSLESLNMPLSIISEELGTMEIKGGGQRVVIDPVDGSKNAITGIPLYCTSIAVADSDNVSSIRLGYVINLLTGDEFWAERGTGAFFNSRRISAQQDDVIYMVGYEAQNPGRDIPRLHKLFSEARRTRCFGATALSISYVGYGAVSVFVSPAPSRTFDFGAGYLIVREAGGIVTDTEGRPVESVELNLKKSTPLLAAGNRQLHQKALSLLG